MAGHVVHFVEQASGDGQDRIAILQTDGRIVMLLADGAGGSGGGAEAADLFVREAKAAVASACPIRDPMELLPAMGDIDVLLARGGDVGETTAMVVVIQDGIVYGASVGDSECWYFGGETCYELTCRQYRKPLLGSGESLPVPFGPVECREYLVAGSDGLFKYTAIARIQEVVASKPLDEIPSALVDLVRLRSGRLQDDCCVVVYRE